MENVAGNVLFIVGMLALIESLFVLIFPKTMRNLLKKITKKNELRKVAVAEFLLALVLIFIGLALI